MESKKEITRKEFLVLTFTLIGSTAAIGNCDDDDNDNITGLGGRGGTTGTGGTSGTTGNAGRGGSGGAGGGGGTGTAACADPLPESQLPDTTGHVHTVTVPASALSGGSAQMFMTSVVLGHQHTVTLQPADLSALMSGGSVTVTSSVADLHAHMYSVNCR
jgi:hypothetical protein